MNSTASTTNPRSAFLAGWGIACFVIFLLCLGTAEYKYVCALAGAVLMAWAYWAGGQLYPSGGTAAGGMATWLPVSVGALCLGVLAIAPLVTGSPRKYLAFVQALTGIRI